MKEVNSNRLPALLLGLLLPAGVIVLWIVASRTQHTVLPSPTEVLAVLAHPWRPPRNLDSPSLLVCAGISLARVLIGYVLAVICAVPLGLAAGRIKPIRQLITPLVELARPICPIAWLPLAIILFGLSSLGTTFWGQQAWRHGFLNQIQWAMVAIIWWGAFFPVFLATMHGCERVRRLHVEAARVLGAGRQGVFLHVVFPSALPSILSGMRVGLGIAWMVIIAAEIFPGTRAGLGYMITTAHQVAEYEYAFACIVVIGLLGYGMDFIFRRLTGGLGRWTSRER